jgi:hypothetical protein
MDRITNVDGWRRISPLQESGWLSNITNVVIYTETGVSKFDETLLMLGHSRCYGLATPWDLLQTEVWER